MQGRTPTSRLARLEPQSRRHIRQRQNNRRRSTTGLGELSTEVDFAVSPPKTGRRVGSTLGTAGLLEVYVVNDYCGDLQEEDGRPRSGKLQMEYVRQITLLCGHYV